MNSEFWDTTKIHPNANAMKLIAEGAYKNMLSLPN
jgi:hypothetical protein